MAPPCAITGEGTPPGGAYQAGLPDGTTLRQVTPKGALFELLWGAETAIHPFSYLVYALHFGDLLGHIFGMFTTHFRGV